MHGWLQRAINAGRGVFLPSWKRTSVYQQWAPESTELNGLTVATTKSEITIDTEYQPHGLDSPVSFIVEPKRRTRVQRIFGDQFTGWRVGALHFGAWAVVVFLINLIVTIWGITARHSGILLEGDCDRVENLNTGLHVFINVLSTILLSGSNYCMQCLSAPTRSEVDKAHAQRKWLDIGIPSLRNVRHLSWLRIGLWILLALTSLPLHLFYNSAVFGSLSSNDYFAFSVSQSFLDDTECRNCAVEINRNRTYVYSPKDKYWSSYSQIYIPSILQNLHDEAKAGTLERLNPTECLNRYATSIQSNRRNLLLVASDNNFPTADENKFLNGSHVYWASPFYASYARSADQASDAYGWICSAMQKDTACSNNVNKALNSPSTWKVGNNYNCRAAYSIGNPCELGTFPVEYCLSQKAEPHCRLQFDTTIAFLVTGLNLVKAILMFFVAFYVLDEPLITAGDAVASFLSQPDLTTKDMCLLSIHDMRKGGCKEAGPRVWLDPRYKWKDVASLKRRGTTLAIFLANLGVVSFLLALGINALPRDTSRSLSSLASLGYGVVDPRTSITGLANDLVSNAIVANSPQVILSMLYFSYNALFTSFLLSHEWVSYAHKQKGLRVSSRPIGAQRTDYFLQLPYKFGVPLMALSGILHWLVSQAIFLVAIDFYNVYGRQIMSEYEVGAGSMKTCGYSPIAIITVIIFGSLMVIGIVAFGFVPYKQGMPLAGNSSMAISAACHLDEGEDGERVATGRVQWGVVSKGEDGVGHCGFSAGEVGKVEVGEMYAGVRRRSGG